MTYIRKSYTPQPTRWREPRLSVAATLVAFALMACVAGPSAAQQAVSSATLGGRVEDANGAAVGGAAVVVTNLGTNQHLSATTDEDGRFRFAYVPVGDYRLLVECGGFSPTALRLTLAVGQAADVRVTLAVGGLAESVEVMGGAPLVESARTQVSETVTPREVDALPLNGRNYLDLALLLPGVSRTNTGSAQRFAETSAVAGTGLSVAGQRNLNNSFVVDGLSANDDAANLAGTAFSQEVVREFQVVTSGGVAEFGRASGGVVNVVTKSGTNDFSGRVYGFLRNQRLDARNPLAPRKDPLTQAQYGASLGGPVRRDRTFFFANFEQTRRNDAAVITIRPDDAARINRRLGEIAYAGPRVETGVVTAGHDVTNFFARFDHRLGETTSLAARYSLYDFAALNSRTVGGLNASSRGTGLDSRDQTLAASAVTTLGTRTLNEARLQFTRSRLSAPVNDAQGPAVNISGVASFGTATFSPTARALDIFEFTDSVTYQRGAHSFKAGADFLLNRVNITFPGAVQGVYTFTSLANFLAGNYATFQQAFGEAAQFQSNPNLGWFVQDEWRPRADLTVNLGLRYDAQYLPEPIRTDANNFAPRAGLAFAPGDRKTVLRAGFGLYFDRLPLRATSNALQRDGSKYVVAQLGPGDAGAPAFPDVLPALPSSLPTRPNVTRIDPDIENSYSLQYNAQVERELPGGGSLSVGYAGLRGKHLILSRNVNAPTLSAAEARRRGVPNLGRPDPLWGNVSRYESSGVSAFDGLLVAFNQRASSWATVRASYTYSKAIDNSGNFFFSTPQDNADLRA
ncbi:MAG: TonB-dependent receptor, partial [Acidobacteriota bacterium]|nr:TonB-dependent receptor [Acidobacteriota bacterium]